MIFIALGFAAYLFFLGVLRYTTFHNQTFDLAFYTRMAWGIVHGDLWDPILNAHIFGLHLSPVVALGGVLGFIMPTAVALYLIQALALGLTLIPLRRLAKVLPTWLIAGVWCLHPNVAHVGGYEFHPGTVAVLPLAWALVGLAEQDVHLLSVACLGVLFCREDLASVTIIIGLLSFAFSKRCAVYICTFSALYLLIFLFGLHPRFAPSGGSLDQHFGYLGHSVLQILKTILLEPTVVWSHISWRALGSAFLPLLLMPLLQPIWLLTVLPILGLNLLSAFPTTSCLDSHYLTPALPILVGSALFGLEKKINSAKHLSWKRLISITWVCIAAVMSVLHGNFPWSIPFNTKDYSRDAVSLAASRLLKRIPHAVSVQAPDRMLAHLAERKVIKRGPLMDRPTLALTRYVVIDTSYRHAYRHQETLLRTDEEPKLRGWLTRRDYEVVAFEKPLLLFQHEVRFPSTFQRQFLRYPSEMLLNKSVTRCLRLDALDIQPNHVQLTFLVRSHCRSDIALRFKEPLRMWRTELLCDGALVPSKFPIGQWITSVHAISPQEYQQLKTNPSITLGFVRSDGKLIDDSDPFWVRVHAAANNSR